MKDQKLFSVILAINFAMIGLSSIPALFSGVTQGENPQSYYDRVNLMAKIPYGDDILPWATGFLLFCLYPIAIFMMFRRRTSGAIIFTLATIGVLTLEFSSGISIEGPVQSLFTKIWHILIGLTIGLFLSMNNRKLSSEIEA